MTGVRDEAVRLVAKALGIQLSEVDETTALGITPQWDSLAHMRLILAVEKKLNKKLGPEEIVGLTGIQDVIDLLMTGI